MAPFAPPQRGRQALFGEHRGTRVGNRASLCFSKSAWGKRGRPTGGRPVSGCEPEPSVDRTEFYSRPDSSPCCTTIRKASLCDGGYLIGVPAVRPRYRSGNDPSALGQPCLGEPSRRCNSRRRFTAEDLIASRRALPQSGAPTAVCRWRRNRRRRRRYGSIWSPEANRPVAEDLLSCATCRIRTREPVQSIPLSSRSDRGHTPALNFTLRCRKVVSSGEIRHEYAVRLDPRRRYVRWRVRLLCRSTAASNYVLHQRLLLKEGCMPFTRLFCRQREQWSSVR